MFVLATTEIHKVPPTILSRCQRLDFRRIGVREIAEHLARVLADESVTAEAEVLELVARQATGSMRDALSLLDQLLAYGGAHLTLAQARAVLGLATTEAVQALVDSLLAQDVPSALQMVNRLFDQGTDPRQFLVDLLEQLRALLLMLAGGGAHLLNLPEDALARLREQRKYVEPAALVQMIRLFNQAAAEMKLGLQPQLPVELAIVESVLALQSRGVAPALLQADAVSDFGDGQTAPPAPASPQQEGEEESVTDRVADATGQTVDWWRDRWDSVMQLVAQEGEIGERAALRLKFCEPQALDGDCLTLGFYFSVHMEKIQNPKERSVVERALGRVAGMPIIVRCLLTPKEGSLPSGKTKYEEAAADPVVREALKHGAHIVEVYEAET
ncbi:MAG: hypothetical protein ACRDIB_13520 [Ardenticatenaceae bacterium]